MKRCLGCGASFDEAGWRCPECEFEPHLQDGVLRFCEPQGADGFDPDAFDELVQLESASFWFRSRNRLIVAALQQYFPDARRVLEIGCGTGFVLEGIQRAFPRVSIVGAELHSRGLTHAAERVPEAELMQFDARDIPFDREFDMVGAFDVLEHIDTDERVLAQMHDAVKPGGGIVVTVPQHRWLWSATDEYAEHKRRYRRAELLTKMSSAGFKIRRVTSFISLLLPAMLVARMRERIGRRDFEPGREHRQAERFGTVLERVVELERHLINRGLDLRAGGSLLVVAVRP